MAYLDVSSRNALKCKSLKIQSKWNVWKCYLTGIRVYNTKTNYSNRPSVYNMHQRNYFNKYWKCFSVKLLQICAIRCLIVSLFEIDCCGKIMKRDRGRRAGWNMHMTETLWNDLIMSENNPLVTMHNWLRWVVNIIRFIG